MNMILLLLKYYIFEAVEPKFFIHSWQKANISITYKDLLIMRVHLIENVWNQEPDDVVSASTHLKYGNEGLYIQVSYTHSLSKSGQKYYNW